MNIASFGIGTSLTNDFHSLSSGGKEKSKALNMVIKLAGVDGKHCVKISDELSKVCLRLSSYSIQCLDKLHVSCRILVTPIP